MTPPLLPHPHPSRPTPAWRSRRTGLTKRFGERTALDGIDLRVPRGSAFGFLGPNGAGKTTIIRTLLGLTAANAGTMEVLGYPVPLERAQALRRVGAIVEEPRFHLHLTGRENLRIVAAVRGPETRARIDPALARVGLSERAGEKVKSYSMGMRQRLGVARCLLADPLLLILDEPTNGLDPGGIQEFREMIRAMVEQEGRTVFISSHLLDEVEKTCDAAAIVDRGKIIVQGAIAELAQGGGVRHELILGVDDVELALSTLGAERAGARRPPCRRGPARRARRRPADGRRGQRDARAGGRRRDALGARPPQPRAALPGDHVAVGRAGRERELGRGRRGAEVQA